MFSLVSGVWKRGSTEPSRTVLIVGIDGSGKTVYEM